MNTISISSQISIMTNTNAQPVYFLHEIVPDCTLGHRYNKRNHGQQRAFDHHTKICILLAIMISIPIHIIIFPTMSRMHIMLDTMPSAVVLYKDNYCHCGHPPGILYFSATACRVVFHIYDAHQASTTA